MVGPVHNDAGFRTYIYVGKGLRVLPIMWRHCDVFNFRTSYCIINVGKQSGVQSSFGQQGILAWIDNEICPQVRTESLVYSLTSMVAPLKWGNGYKKWYQDWGHCGVTNDLESSTQPEGERPEAVVSFPGRWWHHNDRNRGINFYSIMMLQSMLNLCRCSAV